MIANRYKIAKQIIHIFYNPKGTKSNPTNVEKRELKIKLKKKIKFCFPKILFLDLFFLNHYSNFVVIVKKNPAGIIISEENHRLLVKCACCNITNFQSLNISQFF